MENQNLSEVKPDEVKLDTDNRKTNGPKPENKIVFMVLILVVLALMAGTVFFLLSKKNLSKAPENLNEIGQSEGEEDESVIEKLGLPAVIASGFGVYEEVPVDFEARVPNYTVDSDLGNVVNAADFNFSPEAQKLLAENAFVVVPGLGKEFFPLYESNRYRYTPNFITTDSILHNYHLMFGFLLRQIEEQKLVEELKRLSTGMLEESLVQYEALKGTEWENAAKRNVGFFTVGGKLLDPSIEVSALVSNEVAEELKLIAAHEKIEASPVMNIGAELNDLIDTPQGLQSLDGLKEDYSQYIPRGHYDKTEQLRGYFKSMMWYGRLSFRIKNEDEVKSALLITLALDDKERQARWNAIYEPVNFFVGKSDDIAFYQFKELADGIYDNEFSLTKLLSAQDKFSLFWEAAKNFEAPKINSMPIFATSIQSDRDEEIKGFRFMGQRFTVDAAIFQNLITRAVGPAGEPCGDLPFDSGRMLPKGLDIPAALGSKEALRILDDQGENELACYPENMAQTQKYLLELSAENWTQNLYWGWLYQLRPLLFEKSEGYPAFMRNRAWDRKDLNTFLGSWSQLKHDTILYAKQVYAELGGGMPEEKDDRGYVEPNPYVYARLASLLKMTGEGLMARGLLSAEMKENLERMEDLAISLKIISEKELNNEKLSESEYELIRSYGGQLEHIWLEVNKDEPAFKETASQRDYLDENPAAIIADVATDPNGQVLEVGTGKISTVYVIFPLEGELKIAKGGVYSYYEFPWPLSDRLTDKKWREMLNSESAPALPEWTGAFTAR